jgi:hypothetical protein
MLMRVVDDFFDPRSWIEQEHEHRIYLDDRLDRWAIVDYEDWLWACRWRWSAKIARGGNKIYAYRTGTTGSIEKESIYRWSIYLHVAIMERSGIKRPSSKHSMVDHRNGKELDCRKANLRYATPSMNRRNHRGSMPHDIIEG